MILLNQLTLDEFDKKTDENLLEILSDTSFSSSIYTKWLKDSLAKRLIYDELYGDLLEHGNLRSVLDVGGGFTPLTFILRENCQDYRLLDILSHDQHLKEKVKDFLFEEDWFNFPIKSPLDIVIANDFFPNVDQRLDIFLKRFIPVCSEIRASFTFYNNNRFYLTKRVDAEENLIFYAYNGEMLKFILEKYEDRIEGFSSLKTSFFRVKDSDSVYPNKRHVLICKIKGDLY